MPLFEYKCKHCETHFDELVTHADDPVICPLCKSDKTEKLMSVFAASTGGSGSSATPCGQPSCGSGFK